MELKDLIKSINKKQVYYGPEHEDEINESVTAFPLLRVYSLHEEFLPVARELNQYSDMPLSTYELYTVLFDIIPEQNYFKPWPKKTERFAYSTNEINLVIRMFDCGYKDAISYLNSLFSDDDINYLKRFGNGTL